jgi:HSP20 family protein
MAEAATKLLKTDNKQQADEKASLVQAWHPFESLRREVDRLFEDFDRGSWFAPFRRSIFDIEPVLGRRMPATPAVDIVEKENAYEVTAELPGMDEKNIEVKLENGGLTIRGEKQEAKEEKRKGYHLQERRFGSFERYFAVPEGVDGDKIDASFKRGVLTVTLPKKPEAQKPAKKIDVKVA